MPGKLVLSMLGTLAAIVAFTTLVFAVVMDYLGVFDLYYLVAVVAGFNVLQWLLAPYFINMLYHVREADPAIHADLYYTVRRLASKAGLPTPKLMIADVPFPNAFAYGSPLTGNMVAVTRGLLDALDEEEIEAVIGHELGHLRHRDVQVMMLLSMLPSVFYLIARSAFYTPEERRERGEGLALVGVISLIAYWVLSLMILHFSRLREYYADEFSVSLAPTRREGARRLAEALAKIVTYTARLKVAGAFTSPPGFKALLISDPDNAISDAHALSGGDWELVERISRREVSLAERIFELFSTHPNMVKRIRRLKEIASH